MYHAKSNIGIYSSSDRDSDNVGCGVVLVIHVGEVLQASVATVADE